MAKSRQIAALRWLGHIGSALGSEDRSDHAAIHPQRRSVSGRRELAGYECHHRGDFIYGGKAFQQGRRPHTLEELLLHLFLRFVLTLISKKRNQSASGISGNGFGSKMPTLLTSTSTAGNVAMTASAPAASEKSATMPSTFAAGVCDQ
jgi:hypothetical protein